MSGGLLKNQGYLLFWGKCVGKSSPGQHARMNRLEGRGIWPRNPKVLSILLKTAITIFSTFFVTLLNAKRFPGGFYLPNELQLFCRNTDVGNLTNRQPQWNLLSLPYWHHLILVPNVKVSLPAELLLSSLFCQLCQRESYDRFLVWKRNC